MFPPPKICDKRQVKLIKIEEIIRQCTYKIRWCIYLFCPSFVGKKTKHFFYSCCCWNFFYVFVLSLDDGIEPGSVTLSHFKIQVKYFFVFFFSLSVDRCTSRIEKKSRQSHVCTIVFLNVIITVSLETLALFRIQIFVSDFPFCVFFLLHHLSTDENNCAECRQCFCTRNLFSTSFESI